MLLAVAAGTDRLQAPMSRAMHATANGYSYGGMLGK